MSLDVIQGVFWDLQARKAATRSLWGISVVLSGLFLPFCGPWTFLLVSGTWSNCEISGHVTNALAVLNVRTTSTTPKPRRLVAADEENPSAFD